MGKDRDKYTRTDFDQDDFDWDDFDRDDFDQDDFDQTTYSDDEYLYNKRMSDIKRMTDSLRDKSDDRIKFKRISSDTGSGARRTPDSLRREADRRGRALEKRRTASEPTDMSEDFEIDSRQTSGRKKPAGRRTLNIDGIVKQITRNKRFAGMILIAALIVILVIVIGLLIKNSNSLKYSNAEKAKIAAEELVVNENNLTGAIDILNYNIRKDKDGSMQEMRNQYTHQLILNAKNMANAHMRNYDYNAAAQELEPVLQYNQGDAADPNLQKLYETCLNFVNVVEWTGPVEHIFFHSLIYDPAKTFIGDYQTQDFDESYVTVNEYRRMLDRLYENNFILYDIRKLCIINADGTVSPNTIYVPEGKKPLVMSFDDASYYDYMAPYGFVQGVDIDEEGNPVTFMWNDDGTKTYVEDGDYQPILEKFIDEHPDFTYGGARGTIAFTGYEGVLGYRTNEIDSPDYQQIAEEAQRVAEGLKARGWTFASHSYGHRDFFERDEEWYADDTARWEREVVPIIGPTEIFIYPFGTNPTDWNDPKQLNFIAHGFKIFCGVYREPVLDYHTNFMFMQRINVDGIALDDGRLDTLMDMTGIEETEVRP